MAYHYAHHRSVHRRYNGKGPYPCWLCKAPVVYMTGQWPESLAVHHVDLNPENNRPTNLVAMHRRCHGKWHEALRSAEEAEYAD